MPAQRASVGLRRIPRSTARSVAQATRNARKDFQSLLKNLNLVFKNIDNVTPDILRESLEPTFKRSQELVPVDTGLLKASGFLDAGTFRGKPAAAIGYAKGNTPAYAIHVHEDLEAIHKSPTQAKFLQTALQENIDNIASNVANIMQKIIV